MTWSALRAPTVAGAFVCAALYPVMLPTMTQTKMKATKPPTTIRRRLLVSAWDMVDIWLARSLGFTLHLLPGDHSLQLVLAGADHHVGNPPITSVKIIIHVVSATGAAK